MSVLVEYIALFKQIINEVGDLEGLNAFPYKKISSDKYSFLTPNNETIEVRFTPILSTIIKPELPEFEVTNVGFTVNGNDSQHSKNEGGYLLVILKTVFDITMEYIQNNNPSHLFISGTNKDIDNSIISWDKQKTELYQAIVIKNLHKLPGNWKYEIIYNALGIEGKSLLISKIK